MTVDLAAFARFTNGVRSLIANGEAFWKAQRDVGSYRNQNIFNSFIVGTGGPQTVGASGDLPVTNLGTSGNIYLHFKLPIKLSDTGVMFHLRLEGYSYGTSTGIDITWAGIIASGALNKAVKGTNSPFAYLDANNNVVVRCLFPSVYYASFTIASLSADETRRIKRGQLVGVASTAATVNF